PAPGVDGPRLVQRARLIDVQECLHLRVPLADRPQEGRRDSFGRDVAARQGGEEVGGGLVNHGGGWWMVVGGWWVVVTLLSPSSNHHPPSTIRGRPGRRRSRRAARGRWRGRR